MWIRAVVATGRLPRSTATVPSLSLPTLVKGEGQAQLLGGRLGAWGGGGALEAACTLHQDHMSWDHKEDGDSQSRGGYSNGEGEDHEGHHVDTADMAMEILAELDACVQHYFVTSDAANAQVTEEIGGLDPAVTEPVSITTFLTLPTVTR
jgi:hypothetical protein